MGQEKTGGGCSDKWSKPKRDITTKQECKEKITKKNARNIPAKTSIKPKNPCRGVKI